MQRSPGWGPGCICAGLPDIPALEYAGYCRPALGVGGDYYDFLVSVRGRLGLAIADFSGNGVPATLLMASLQVSTRNAHLRHRNTQKRG